MFSGHEKDARGDAKQFRIAPVKTLADFEQCVEVQLAVWGYSDSDLIPKRVFIVAERIGGQVLGAYDGRALVGFAMALPGYRDGRPYLHSHMLAVLPEYRNAGLGRRLKLAQRDDALERGIDLMEWTFDPLEIKNAHLNIARLGAIARRYMRNIYGPSTSPLQGGLPTDRLVVEWWLRSERVRRALGEETAETGAGDRGRRGGGADRRAVHRPRLETRSAAAYSGRVAADAQPAHSGIGVCARARHHRLRTMRKRRRLLPAGTGERTVRREQGTGNREQHGTSRAGRTTQGQDDNNADHRRSSSTRDQHASRVSFRD